MAGLCLAACAGPSPQIQTVAADDSQPATGDSSASGQAAANESAAAATDEPKPDSPDAAASDSESPSAAGADSATASQPQETSAPAPVPATEPEQTTAASQPEQPQESTAPAPAPAPAPAQAGAAPPEQPQEVPTPASAPATEPQQTAAAPQPEQPQTAAGSTGIAAPGSGLATGRPYVVIRFPESNVDYEKPLSEAVKRALARKPDLAFDLVAVTPRAGTAEELADLTEQAHAEAAAVMKSLSNLGIGPERVSIMTWTGQPTDVNEIRLYIR